MLRKSSITDIRGINPNTIGNRSRKIKHSELTKVSTKDPTLLQRLVAENGVVQITSPPSCPAKFTEFLSTLGPLMFTEGETPVEGHPLLNVVTNVNRKTKPKSVFHSDTSYISRPPSFSALFAVDVPKKGGATIFTDQYRVFDTLRYEIKSLLAGAMVLHGATGVPDKRSQWHPIIRRNPITKRNALYLTSLPRCLKLKLSDGTDRSDLIKYLYHFTLSVGQVKRHQWCAGDVILWDNRCTLHAADHSDVVGSRTLYRGMVRGEKPIPG